MRSTKKRIVTGIVTAALAIVPFTGTGIDAVDKALTKSTAITADAYGNTNMTRGYYYVNRQFTCVDGVGSPVTLRAGQVIFIDSDGRYMGCMMDWYAKKTWGNPVPYISLMFAV